MKPAKLDRSTDRLGNNVTFAWLNINRWEAAVLTRMTREDSCERLLDYPYGFTLMKTGYEDTDVADYYIVISSEVTISQQIVDTVSEYISAYTE